MGVVVRMPKGYDAGLAGRAIAAAGGGRIHYIANLTESYWGAALLAREPERARLEQKIRRFLSMPTGPLRMTHRFVGRVPATRTNHCCRILEHGTRFLEIQFQDGSTEHVRRRDVRRLDKEASERSGEGEKICAGCSDRGQHLSLVKGFCEDCRQEIALRRGVEL